MEIEKKLLEQQPDFNTVAVFSVIDVNNFGYLDFGNLKCFMKKFNKDVSKPEIHAIIRRASNDINYKIDFREFA